MSHFLQKSVQAKVPSINRKVLFYLLAPLLFNLKETQAARAPLVLTNNVPVVDCLLSGGHSPAG